MKRFFTTASTASVETGFSVLLDGKPVKTPAQYALIVPSRSLAEAIAAEWNAQREKIEPATMLLMKFANTVIDGVAGKMDKVRDSIASYTGTDLLFYLAEGPDDLVARQNRAWQPVLAWLRKQGMDFKTTQGVIHIPQAQTSLAALAEKIKTYDPFTLAALSSMTTLTGSACLSLAVIEDFLSVEAAWDAAHLDEDWQIEQWGPDDEITTKRSEKWKEMEAAARMLALLKA